MRGGALWGDHLALICRVRGPHWQVPGAGHRIVVAGLHNSILQLVLKPLPESPDETRCAAAQGLAVLIRAG